MSRVSPIDQQFSQSYEELNQEVQRMSNNGFISNEITPEQWLLAVMKLGGDFAISSDIDCLRQELARFQESLFIYAN